MMGNFELDRYNAWCKSKSLSPGEKDELRRLSQKDVQERFGNHLDFSVAGMRGIMGMGTNRINKFTIRRATKGLADFLLAEIAGPQSVAIAYDTRKHSREFAQETAGVLVAAGVKVCLFQQPTPVSILSFAIRELHCTAGVAITASHNTKEYNGYKVYDHTGCQMLPDMISKLTIHINTVEDVFGIPSSAQDKSFIHAISPDVIEHFLTTISKSGFLINKNKENFRIVYTPLHGAGSPFVEEALNRNGFSSVSLVREQLTPDGAFPTVKQPNPQEPEALNLAIDQGMKEHADLVIGTDPDCDRIGVAALHKGQLFFLTGNQIGALLTNFLIEMIGAKSGTLLQSVISGDLSAAIAAENRKSVITTLPGFKYIGRQMDNIEDFLLGYEESHGYLVGTFARDKDGVSAALAICEMAQYYSERGQSLIDVLNHLYDQHGHYLDKQESFVYKGPEGIQTMKEIMTTLRKKGRNALDDIGEIQDYLMNFKNFSETDMIKYVLRNGSWVAVRPSGTEPKLKVYYSIKMDDLTEAKQYYDRLSKQIREIVVI